MEIVSKFQETPVAGYLARPASGARSPAILLEFEVFGLNQHMREVCDRLASEGFVVFAPDFYVGKQPRVASTIPEAIVLAEGMTDQKFEAIVGDAISYIKACDFVAPAKLGSLGFCMGGRISYFAACFHPDEIGCAVCYYPGGIGGIPRYSPHTMNPLAEAKTLKSPLLFFFGDSDPYVPVTDVEAIRERLSELKKAFEMKVYSGAGHGFFHPDRQEYRADLAEESWRVTVSFFRTHLQPNSGK